MIMKDSARPHTVSMTLEEGGLVMEALAEYPFKTVFELIGKLNQQANFHAASAHAADEPCQFSLAADELSLILQALGELPFKRVQGLMVSLHNQIVGKPSTVVRAARAARVAPSKA